MINLIRLNGDPIILNAELIETVETTPNTVIMLASGKKWVVKETAEEVVQKIIAYKRLCFPDIRELYPEDR